MTHHIVHLTTAHIATDTRIFDKEAISLVDAGYDVTLLAHHDKSEIREGVNIRSLGTANSRPERWRHTLTAMQQARQLDADLYHFHDPELLFAGLYLSEATDSGVVFDVHEDYSHKITGREWIPEYVKPIISRGYPVAQNLISRRFDALVTVTEPIAQELRKGGLRVEVVRNYPRTAPLPEVNGYIDREHEFVLVYTGGLSEVRGIFRMLCLLRKLRDRGTDVTLWCLGRWDPAAEPKARQYIADNGLESHVRFPGYLDYVEMFRWLKSADLGLALLDVEYCKNSIPTKIFEYMYSELPIIGTDLSAADQLLSDVYYWAVPELDTESQADTVEEVLQENTDSVGIQARQDVEGQFSWEQEFKTLENLYSDLLR